MNKDMIQFISLLEESGKEAFNQTLNKATKEDLEKATESKVKLVLKDSSSSTVSISIGTFISKFRQAFLQIYNSKVKRSQRNEAMVSAFVGEPLITGLEQLRVANEIVSFSEKDMQYRVERFRNALYSLDRARSLASEEFEIAFIDILRGLCTFEIPGGISEALVHLTSFQIWANKEVKYLFSVKEEKQRKAKLLNIEIDELKYLLKLKPGNDPLNLSLQSTLRRAQSLQIEINEISLLETKILDIIFYITMLLEIAQKIINESVQKQ